MSKFLKNLQLQLEKVDFLLIMYVKMIGRKLETVVLMAKLIGEEEEVTMEKWEEKLGALVVLNFGKMMVMILCETNAESIPHIKYEEI